MRHEANVAVIIPAFNEEPSVGKVVSAIPAWIDDVVVVDNGSSDATAEVARAHGARVVSEPRRGYGSACLTGIAALKGPGVVVFLDADFSDYPEEMSLLVDPIAQGEADMVIGSRTLGRRESGALTPQARFGNWLACTLIRLLWKVSYSDLGPFRAVRLATLRRLDMRDRNYGWTVEMQIKAAREGIRIREAPVSYRRRIGKSKVSGTVRGVLGAGTKILYTIFLAAAGALPGDEERAPRERLIVFTRYPEPGKTKSRLIPVLGAEGAAEFQRQMTEHAMAQAREVINERLVSVEVRYEGGDKRLIRKWLGPGLSYCPQGNGGLGERMARAFREAFEAGMERVVLVGTDCPSRTAAIMQGAFDALIGSDLVLGPASDGGYYLIGLRRMAPELFVDMPWGTAEVMKRTMNVAERVGISTVVLETLDDVDRPEDLPVWEREVRGRSAMRVSVIVPTLNEALTVAATLASIGDASDMEVIVVDGGSSDETVEAARAFDVKILVSAPGRAKQMNAGAAAATGDALLFLHADTRLPRGFEEHVRRTLDRPGAVAGAFRLRIDAPARRFRAIERVINWRSGRLQMPYGDQALFLRARLFREMGGFPDIPIMEDFEFVRRLRRRGTVGIVFLPVVTSARRWLALGPWRTTLFNQMAIAAYYAGVSLPRIARWYRRDF